MNNQVLSIVILVVLVLIVIGYIYYQIKTKGLRKTVIDLIVYAEVCFQKGENVEKFSYVVNALRETLPLPLRFIFTEQNIRKFVQNIFDEIKNALDYDVGDNLLK